MMRLEICLFAIISLSACTNQEQSNNTQDSTQSINDEDIPKSVKDNDCWYVGVYKDLGNQLVDTILIEGRLTDPIDDFINFKEVEHGFVLRGEEVFKKAVTHVGCNGKPIDVAFYQDLTDKIDLTSFKPYNDRYFTTKGKVFFWWVNSGGHLIFPINDADPDSFKPFKAICGGVDKKSVYYGCPNFGVYPLNIPRGADFSFIPKEDSYWNAPKHYIVIDDLIYDVKYSMEKGYYCELDDSLLLEDILPEK